MFCRYIKIAVQDRKTFLLLRLLLEVAVSARMKNREALQGEWYWFQAMIFTFIYAFIHSKVFIISNHYMPNTLADTGVVGINRKRNPHPSVFMF